MTGEDTSEDGIGRRDAMKAGALAAGGLAIGSVGSEKATAQTNPERLQLGSEWTLDDKDDGSIVLKNTSSGATLEYDDNAGSWSVGAINTESVSSKSVDTEDLLGAKQVSQHSSVQAALDAAGQDGTVVFDADGGPYTLSSEPSIYDGQTIILHADLEANYSSAGQFFNLSGLSGVTIKPNGHLCDGLDRTGNVASVVNTDATTSDCHVEGVLRATRTYDRVISFQGADCTADTVIADTIGNPAGNNNRGDCVNFGSTAAAKRCKVETVIAEDCTRHTVTFGSSGPSECEVDTVISRKPGGAHVAMEYATDCTVNTVYGDDGRYAATYTSETDYANYPVIAFLAANSTGTTGSTVGRVIDTNQNGSGPTVAFSSGCNDNSVEDLTTINPPENGVDTATGAGNSERNHIGIRRIVGATDGVNLGPGSPDNTVSGVGAGVIRECDEFGVYNGGNDDVTIEGLTIRANHQAGTATPASGIYMENGQFGVLLENNKIADGASGNQTIGVAAEAINGISQIRYVANDTIDSTTPWDVDGAANTDSAKAGNVPSPTL